MGRCTGKHKQRYVNFPRYQSQLAYQIHVPGHSSDECKIRNIFGTKYAKYRHFKECSKYPTYNKRRRKKQDVSYIVQQAVNEIIPQ